MTEQRTPETEIEQLDREAREALDRLADKREELERRHRETELAAERQRERKQERRRAEEREARERAHREAVEKAEKLGAERLRLEVLAEEQAKALGATLGELLDLEPVHRRAVVEAHGEAPEQFFSWWAFKDELRDWFAGRFKGVIPGIGGDLRHGLSLPERDALTPKQR